MRLRYIPLALLILAACKSSQPVASHPSFLASGPAWGALWQQRSAEYKALCLQAYQVAAARVEEMSHQQTLRPRAIVTDIDETILDNSAYSAQTALAAKSWSQQSWAQWTAKAAADTVPGALAFFRFAAEKGFTIYYISNRLEAERPGTLKNLQRFNFPSANNEHLLLSDGSSNKTSRRKKIEQQYEIAMLVGDNLADFSEAFYHKNTEERSNAVTELQREFGQRFIVLPNAMYGDWLSALFPRGANLSPQQMDSTAVKAIKIPQ